MLPPADAARLLARRVLVRAAAAQLSGCAPDEVHRAVLPRQLRAAGRAWHWSTSSSGPCGLVALSSRPVGVDVEALPGPPEALALAELLLSPVERDWVLAGADVHGRFLTAWVRKEAVVKCTGEGLQRDLRSFAVPGEDVADVRWLDSTPPAHVTVHPLRLDGHVAAVAVGGEDAASG